VPDIVLQHFDCCPSWATARERLHEALRSIGRSDAIRVQLIRSPEEADRAGFRGSPTVLIDGHDPFDHDTAVGFACRVYLTETGFDGSPSVEQLRRALVASISPR
jgi:hypothetical protein